MIRVAIAGAGRMGQSIASLLEGNSELEHVGTWGRGDDLNALVAGADVLIDFSLPEATDEVLDSVPPERPKKRKDAKKRPRNTDEESSSEEVEAAVRQTIGTIYSELGQYDAAEPHLTAAAESFDRLLGKAGVK